LRHRCRSSDIDGECSREAVCRPLVEHVFG
jgi:hypothetical protein